MEDSQETFVSSVEDFSPPPSPSALSELTDVSDGESRQSDEDDDRHEHHEAFGVQPYMFEPLLEPGSAAAVAAAAAEATQTHPRDGMPVDQW